MTRARTVLTRIAVTTLGLLPALALAHPGHGNDGSFAAGALHPLDGMQHLLPLIAAGVLASQLAGRTLLLLSAVLLGLAGGALSSHTEVWQFAAGYMLTSVSVIAAVAAATRLYLRFATAGGRRSPT